MKSQTVANRPSRSVDDIARLSLATIGYQGAPLPAFLATLKAARVTLLLDVRGLPLSRRKGFSKTPLSEALMRIGIGYRHERALGVPRSLRRRLRDDGDLERYVADFRDYPTDRPARRRLGYLLSWLSFAGLDAGSAAAVAAGAGSTT